MMGDVFLFHCDICQAQFIPSCLDDGYGDGSNPSCAAAALPDLADAGGFGKAAVDGKINDYQLVGSREKLQETPIFHGNIYGFL